MFSTRAGKEYLARFLRAATEADHEATVLSVDGVGAFDHVSRASMFSLLASHEAGACGSFLDLRYDNDGMAHVVEQGEGREQGDPLMPGLFALAQHPVTFISSRGPVVRVSMGKTRAWDAGGVLPPGVEAFGSAEDPSWVGDPSLPPDKQGLAVGPAAFRSHKRSWPRSARPIYVPFFLAAAGLLQEEAQHQAHHAWRPGGGITTRRSRAQQDKCVGGTRFCAWRQQQQLPATPLRLFIR